MVLHRDCGAYFAGLNRGDDVLWLNATVPLHELAEQLTAPGLEAGLQLACSSPPASVLSRKPTTDSNSSRLAVNASTATASTCPVAVMPACQFGVQPDAAATRPAPHPPPGPARPWLPRSGPAPRRPRPHRLRPA